jgi:hypothetical protein
MRLFHPNSLHKCCDVIGKQLHRIGATGLVGLARTTWIDGKARELLRIVCDLEGITCIVCGEVRDEDQRLPRPLLLVVHRNSTCLDLGHATSSYTLALSSFTLLSSGVIKCGCHRASSAALAFNYHRLYFSHRLISVTALTLIGGSES